MPANWSNGASPPRSAAPVRLRSDACTHICASGGDATFLLSQKRGSGSAPARNPSSAVGR
eukprot:scaffold3993_cov457-Prasinococcus_capsulatus_cf.AAC.1